MLRGLIVGTGQIARIHASSMKASEFLEFKAFLGRDLNKTEALAQDYRVQALVGMEEVLATDYDLAIICTPSHVRKEVIFPLIDKGIHILCEKPLALSSDEARKIVSYAREKGIKFMVGQVLRFWPAYEKIREIIETGLLGKVSHVHSNRSSSLPNWNQWIRNIEKSGGGLYDLAIHEVDFLLSLFGPVKSSSSIGTSDLGFSSTNLVFEEVLAVVESSIDLKGYPFTSSFRAYGDKASLEYIKSRRPEGEDWIDFEEFYLYFEEGARQIDYRKHDPYQKQMEAFASYICAKPDKEPVSNEEVIQVLDLLEEIKKSCSL